MDNFRFITYRGLVVLAIVVVILTAETISSHRYGRQKTGREMGLDIKETEVTTAVSELDVLRGLDLKKGDIHNGIRYVKLYLARFGYLLQQKQEQHAWDDLFDDQLEESLRMYQNNFNLSVTGFLDQETLGTMHIPRCSREDIPDELLIFLSKPSPSKGSLWNQEPWKFAYGKLKWRSTHHLTYAFSSTIAHAESTILSKEDIRNTLASAFDSWAAVVPLNFSETNQFEKANIKIEFVARDHGDGAPFEGPSVTVAHAFPPEDGRFHFNVDKLWTTSCHLTHHPSAFDIQSTAVHDIGHVIGLGHSKVQNSVMYPFLPPGHIRHSLTADDIRGARALYGTRISNHRDQQDDQQEDEEENEEETSHIHLLVVGFLMLAVCLMFIRRHLPRHI
ncbi:hypothetical protein SUGI_0687300 [Cryptomeria japonica]|uniref:metalloendoproteinase 1-like n=1 Tax=Cryptomeria japonica TaxID=3369 RepID=UPI0024147ACD|nr:metalloendoproteinase 1-like [Cryptomeria japonica]GLJ34193.1 hypothetical protein SUGI_0687300 [Cryptomeria japonica]